MFPQIEAAGMFRVSAGLTIAARLTHSLTGVRHDEHVGWRIIAPACPNHC
jgi:hypothetical protein